MVLSYWFNTPSSQRIVLISKLLVGSSNNNTSGLENKACANNTRSLKPGATSLMVAWCKLSSMPTPLNNSAARASAV